MVLPTALLRPEVIALIGRLAEVAIENLLSSEPPSTPAEELARQITRRWERAREYENDIAIYTRKAEYYRIRSEDLNLSEAERKDHAATSRRYAAERDSNRLALDVIYKGLAAILGLNPITGEVVSTGVIEHSEGS